MKWDQILSVLTIMILIFGGTSVFVHSASGEEIETEQDEKQEEKVEDAPKEDKSIEGSESLETEAGENREENEEGMKTTDNTQDLEEENSNLNENAEDEEKTDLEENARLTQPFDINKQSDHSPYIDTVTLRGNDDYDHELILDEYDIVFQDNMTALTADANFSIYRIEIDDEIWTAKEIIEYRHTDDIIENISENMTEVFIETINSTFPYANREFDETTSDYGEHGPINFSTSADIYLTKKSLGFNETNDRLNMSDVIQGTMKMGANINKEVELNVKPGHNSTYRFEVPSSYIMEADDTWGEWGGKNHTWDNDKERVSTWIFNNSKGDEKVVLERELRMKHKNPVDIEKEDIHATGLFDMKSFEDVSITNTVNISSVDIADYQRPGTDESMLPDNIENLDIVTADGLRLFIDNNLTDLQQIEEQSLDDSIEDLEGNIENIFGEEPDMESEWDRSTVTGYDIEDMGTSPPFRCYINSTEDVGFTNDKLDLPQEAEVNEVINETLKLDANVITEPEFNVQEGIFYVLNILAPRKVEFSESEDQHYLYQKEIDNRDGYSDSTHLSLDLSWADEDKIREVTEEDISIDGTFDLRNLEKINLTLNISISSVDVEKYDDFTLPNTVENLDYVDAKFIRTSVDNDLLEWKTIIDEMNSSVEEIENKIPGFLGDVTFDYYDPEKDSGTIIRRYKAEDFQPTFTADDEEIDIDNELTESLMNSGAVIDFELPSMEEKYDDYSILLKLYTPEFMVLHDDNGERSNEDGYYGIDPKEGFEGELRSDKEVPDEQSINIDINIDLESVSIRTDILNMDYKADANTLIDAKIEVTVVEAPEDIRNSLPEDITLEYATADLIRQAEKREIFDKQQILNMARDGEDIRDFDGVNQTLRDALGNEDIGVSTRYQEGTWEPTDDVEDQPIVLLIDSEFEIPLKESTGGNAFDIYSINMGEIEIPAIEGIDTNFRIVFPDGIRAEVEETDNVNVGETSDSRSYIEVDMDGDSEDEVTINPEIIITSGILFSSDVYLHGIPLIVLTLSIISLIILGVVIKIVPYQDMIRKKLIRNGMEDAVMEENDPDRWLDYIPEKKVEKYDITQDTLVELELEEELQEMREEDEWIEESEVEEELTTDEETSERVEDSTDSEEKDEEITG